MLKIWGLTTFNVAAFTTEVTKGRQCNRSRAVRPDGTVVSRVKIAIVRTKLKSAHATWRQ